MYFNIIITSKYLRLIFAKISNLMSIPYEKKILTNFITSQIQNISCQLYIIQYSLKNLLSGTTTFFNGGKSKKAEQIAVQEFI